ncbi:MAG TPA: DEAD/DEAH box helicase [Stellaceae bacterium]|jgi:superfamily II DNA/RNA helicase|nr:DEAD/DEAH box helicase [Stellaceae bacterium]
MSFEDLGLSPEVLKAVVDAGYTAPTPIQEQAIPYVLMGRDVLGCAQTGTGKTASFTLPMIDILAAGRARARMPRSLIIEPTRELAAQVAEAFDVYGKYHKLEQALLIGGESFSDQERKLDRGVDVLIATPGRLIDLYERGKILLSDVKILVIDEADRMLDMGFIPDVERIVGLLSKIRQTLFFSATMPPEIRRLADAFLMNPKEISVAPPASPAALVTQGLAIVTTLGKRDALRRLIRNEDVKNAIIFCNRKRDVDVLYRSLAKHGFDAAALHGDMPQSKRTETLERFRNNEIRLLVASDVAARGLDIQGMSHVFNFDVPIHAEDYVHRIGRTGRAGREGRAFTLATPEDGRFVEAIQQLIGKPIPVVEIAGIGTEAFLEGDDAPRGRGRGRTRGGRSGKPAGRSAPRAEAAQEAKPAREHHEAAHEHREPPHEHREPKRERHEPKRERARPAAKEPAFAPITMNPDAIDQAALPDNVTKLPRRDHHEHDHEDDRRVVGFGDHMPAFLGRARATRSL